MLIHEYIVAYLNRLTTEKWTCQYQSNFRVEALAYHAKLELVALDGMAGRYPPLTWDDHAIDVVPCRFALDGVAVDVFSCELGATLRQVSHAYNKHIAKLLADALQPKATVSTAIIVTGNLEELRNMWRF